MNKILNLLHWHRYDKPIVSQYVSFNQRDIIFECKCGKRKMERVTRDFSTDFPIKTTNYITTYEMLNILNGLETPK